MICGQQLMAKAKSKHIEMTKKIIGLIFESGYLFAVSYLAVNQLQGNKTRPGDVMITTATVLLCVFITSLFSEAKPGKDGVIARAALWGFSLPSQQWQRINSEDARCNLPFRPLDGRHFVIGMVIPVGDWITGFGRL